MLADWIEGDLSGPDCETMLAELKQDHAFQETASQALLVRRHLEQGQFPTDSFTKQIIGTLRKDDAGTGQDLTRDVIANLQVSQKRKNHRQQFTTIAAIAAAFVISFLIWFQYSGTSDSSVASVIGIDGEALINQGRTLVQGDTLSAGDVLTMKSGLVELVFQNTGVHAIATAPLSLTAKSGERIFLHIGDVKLHVPPQGVGFVVETAEREITDLGTSFVVTAQPKGSRVFVLDGQIEVGEKDGDQGRLMTEGEVASFGQNGEFNLISEDTNGLLERSNTAMGINQQALQGMILGINSDPDFAGNRPIEDIIGKQIAPLLRSGFQERSCLEGLAQGRPFRFSGIAGCYNYFADRSGLKGFEKQAGWLAWYHGNVSPPHAGRYRFWGYADNNLMVAIDGNPVFDGSRYDSSLHRISKVVRQNHPAWPCLNARAGFASGPWVTLGEGPVQIDILFGELAGTPTSGLLLVEFEDSSYETTFWGQPKWPLLLTENPTDSDRLELEKLRLHMEAKLLGSFSVSDESIWKVH